MIDRSHFLPAGSLVISDDRRKVGGVYCYATDYNTKKVMFPGYEKGYDISKEKKAITVIWDYFKRKADGSNLVYQMGHSPELYESQKNNYLKNRKEINAFKGHKFEKRDTVVVCGSGPSLEPDIEAINRNRDDVCVVTINAAQAKIEGDYFVTSERLDVLSMSATRTREELEGYVFNNTIAHVSTVAHPNVVKAPWKKITFFSHGFHYEKPRICVPVHFVGRHSTFDALQFAVLKLKAKKVIFTGCDYMYGNQLERLSVSIIEAASLIASINGVDVWNVSQRTAFKNGVKLGSFDEAMSSPIIPEGKGEN